MRVSLELRVHALGALFDEGKVHRELSCKGTNRNETDVIDIGL